MKKIIYMLCLTAWACAMSVDLFATVGLISGPNVRIPGISTRTVVQVLDFSNREIRWWHNGSIVGGGPTFHILQGGSYMAQANLSTNPNNPLWVNAGSITIPNLIHSIDLTGANPINPTSDVTYLCVNSNGSSYIVSRNWYRNAADENYNGDPNCRLVSIPGAYSVEVTYQFGSQSATIAIPATMIFPALQAPAIHVTNMAYNPVTPPVLTATNASTFQGGIVYWYKDFQLQTSGTSYAVPGPGVYICHAVWSGLIVNSIEIRITKGSIPAPYISSDGGTTLTYEDPDLLLSTQNGYSSGYMWYFNNQALPGTTGVNLTVFKPGSYTVRGCALFPDGTTECKTSAPVQIAGEALFVNYVRSKIPLIENITTPAQLDALAYTQANVSTTYADGFARPLQQVQRALSPAGLDITSFFTYDAFGREVKKFLPFTRQTSDGSYYHIPGTFSPLYDFYQRDNDKIANTAYPYAEAKFESSPLSRLQKQGAPGEEWQLSTGHVKSYSYTTNLSSDNVRKWTSSAQGLMASVNYAPGSLSVTEMKDENGNVTREFKDKASHTLLVEKIVEGGNKLRTYYVYDDPGRLSHVLPPKTISALPVTGTVSVSNDVLSRECFSYQYDERNRIVKKNIPGAGTTCLVYDLWDRVALSQHANQRTKNKWSFTKYDVLDRPILTGEIYMEADHSTAVQMIADFYATVSTNPLLRYESSGGTVHGFTNRSFPLLVNENQVYTVTYYDDYTFLPQFGSAYQFTPEPSLGLTENFTRNQKLVTGTKTIILGTTTYLKSVHYYNKRHQLIQVVDDNHLGGVDRMSTAYDFTGKAVKAKMVHNGLQTVTIDQEFTYDHTGRKLKIFHTINDGERIMLADHHYNELGQLTEKNIHSTDGNTFLQSLDYAYNIRGWLSQVNPTETESNATYQDQYGFELAYTTTPSSGIADFHPAFNGNITAFTEVRPSTQDAGGTFKSAYSYRYDARDQLIRANYYQLSNPVKNSVYDMPVITYDPNGNISSLKRKGITASGAPGLIDDLTYFYNGNQLIRVDDLADQVKGFVNK